MAHVRIISFLGMARGRRPEPPTRAEHMLRAIRYNHDGLVSAKHALPVLALASHYRRKSIDISVVLVTTQRAQEVWFSDARPFWNSWQEAGHARVPIGVKVMPDPSHRGSFPEALFQWKKILSRGAMDLSLPGFPDQPEPGEPQEIIVDLTQSFSLYRLLAFQTLAQRSPQQWPPVRMLYAAHEGRKNAREPVPFWVLNHWLEGDYELGDFSSAPRRLSTILQDLRKFASRDHFKAELDATQRELQRDYPDASDEGASYIESGRKAREALASVKGLMQQLSLGNSQVHRAVTQAGESFPELERAIQHSLKLSQKGQRRRQWRRESLRTGDPLTAVRAGLPHGIDSLPPSESWRLVVTHHGRRVIGVLAPQDSSLPAIPLRLEDAEPAEVDQALQSLLDAAGVGILGLTMEEENLTERQGVVEPYLQLIGWVLRRLPLPSDGRIEFKVGIAGGPGKGLDAVWTAGRRKLQQELMRRLPQRARSIWLDIQGIGEDLHTLRDYARLLSEAWADDSLEGEARIQASGLQGACLHQTAISTLSQCWEGLAHRAGPSATIWTELLLQHPGQEALCLSLLSQLRLHIKRHPRYWLRLTREAMTHMESKNIDLPLLGRQVEWLERNRPESMHLPGALLTALAYLQTIETEGLDEEQIRAREQELETISSLLLPEEPRLICQVELHRVLRMSSRLQHARALDTLEPWLEMDFRIPGRQLSSRLLAIAGQQLACLERLDEAEQLTLRALESFSELSDPHWSLAERQLTSGQLAAICMERSARFPEPTAWVKARRSLVSVTGMPSQTLLPLAQGGLAFQESYQQYILLRYLWMLGTEAEVTSYLDAFGEWQSGSGFPWDRIFLYRGLLLVKQERRELAREWLTKTWEAHLLNATPGQRLLACCAAAALRWVEPEWRWLAAEDTLREIQEALPALAPCVERLRLQFETPEDPERWLYEALPFNLR